MTTYKIVRFHELKYAETIKSGLTLKQAQKHCNHPETSSSTGTGKQATLYTRMNGHWFDGWTKE